MELLIILIMEKYILLLNLKIKKLEHGLKILLILKIKIKGEVKKLYSKKNVKNIL